MNIVDIFVRPVITERTLEAITNKNRYTFIVNRKASKTDVSKACKILFGIEPVSVQTVVMKGGKKRIMSRRASGYTTSSDWKKAVVLLKPGDTISLFETGESKKEKKEKRKEKKEEIKTVKAEAKKEAKAPKIEKKGLGRLLGRRSGEK